MRIWLSIIFALACLPCGAQFQVSQRAFVHGGSAPACGTYTHYRVITVPAQSSLSGNLTDYPLLISGTYSYLATVANGGLVQNTNGYDVGFFTDATCATKLPWETEQYTATNGQVVYWVQVPTISQSASITFVLAYDNTTISTDQSNATGTWDSNFFGVYHMVNSGCGGTCPGGADSTGYSSGANNMATAVGTITPTTGQIDGAQTFSASSYFTVGANGGGANFPSSGGNIPITVSGWVNISSFTSCASAGACVLASFGEDSGSPTGYYIGLNTTGEPETGFASSTAAVIGTPISTGTWTMITGVYNQSTNTIYLNGGTSNSSISFSTGNISGHTMRIASYLVCCTTPGIVDEVRFSGIARSTDWIATDYASQSSPSTFYSVGSQH